MGASGRFGYRRADDANALDAGVESFFDDHLKDRLRYAVSIYKREKFLLDRAGGRKMTGAPSGCGDDGFLNGVHSLVLPPLLVIPGWPTGRSTGDIVTTETAQRQAA
jgi:hypothetical protein